MIATVVAAGISTVQDGGRRGFAEVGVPVSGAWHRERYLLAVGLLTGHRDESVPTIELLAGDCILDLHVETTMAIVGPARLWIDAAPGAVGACLAVHGGQRIRVEHVGPGPVYLALSGWAPDRVLGSASRDTFSRIGPDLGTMLSGGVERRAYAQVGAFHRELTPSTGPVRVLLTGHPAGADFVSERWHVTALARSGIRLAGSHLPGAGDIPSMPMLPGAIQVTPSGDPVILGPDGGLTGGYPVVGVVATVDLDRLSLVVADDELVFRACDQPEATRAHREHAAALASAIAHPGLLA